MILDENSSTFPTPSNTNAIWSINFSVFWLKVDCKFAILQIAAICNYLTNYLPHKHSVYASGMSRLRRNPKCMLQISEVFGMLIECKTSHLICLSLYTNLYRVCTFRQWLLRQMRIYCFFCFVAAYCSSRQMHRQHRRC